MAHGLRGRPSNRRLEEELRTKALDQARKPVHRDFGPTLLSEHLECDPEVGFVHPSTLRSWMIEAGLWDLREFGAMLSTIHDRMRRQIADGRSVEDVVASEPARGVAERSEDTDEWVRSAYRSLHRQSR